MKNHLNITAPRTETFPVFLMFRFTAPTNFLRIS
jgi:hypothetical protein